MISASYNMHQVSLPRFAGSTNNTGAKLTSADGQSNLGAFLFGSSGDDGMDFDLLAEYLLDEPGPNNTLSNEIPPAATPDSNEFDFSQADPLADAHAQLNQGNQRNGGSDIANDLAQVQHMIAQHAAQAQAKVQAQQPPAPMGAPIPAPAPMVYPHPGAALVSAPQPAPAPMAHVAMSPQGQMARPPAAAPTMIVHHHLPQMQVSGTKRSAPVALPYDVVNGGPTGRRPKSEAQINRRRERNRILARRTRLRKKFFFESLQKEVIDLQRENNALKEIVKGNMEKPLADKVLADASVELPEIVMENCGDATELDRQDFSLIKSLQGSQQCFVITDPSLQDNPIVYASEGFLNVTGYQREEVLGRNCRFLQGTDTSPQKVEQIKKSVSMGEDVSVCIANYCADGTPFWNQLFIAALRDANNNIVNFVGVLVKVAGPPPDDPEHGKVLGGSEVDDEGEMADAAVADNFAEAITDAVMSSVPPAETTSS